MAVSPAVCLGKPACQMLQGMKFMIRCLITSGKAHIPAPTARHVPILLRSTNGHQPKLHRRRHHTMTYAPLDSRAAGVTVWAMDLLPVCPRYPATIRCRQRPLWGLLPLGHTTRTRKTSPSARPYYIVCGPISNGCCAHQQRATRTRLVGHSPSSETSVLDADKGMAAWHFHH